MINFILPVSALLSPVSAGIILTPELSFDIFARDLRIMGKAGSKMKSVTKWMVVVLGVMIAMIAFAVKVSAQSHESFIYGKVHVSGDRTYTGPIRWGSEEVLWTDLFNVAKQENRYRKMVPEKEGDNSWFDNDWSLSGIWEDKIATHRFTCQFGNFKAMEMLGGNRVRLTFKNGGELIVGGDSYNDLGTTIELIDDEIGVVKLDWNRIQKIEFLPTPTRLETLFGTALYGTVESNRREKFTGYIVWDNDERISTDKLDGDTDGEDVSIKFGDVASIEKYGRGSQVVLKSGREFFLTGSNDVNDENRGVIVAIPDIGLVHLSWDAFRKVTFTEPGKALQKFNDFPAPSVLRGTVSRFDGNELDGRIIFDIDEALDMEVLEGNENDIEYIIPFKNIRKITPRNTDFSTVELKNGKSLLLGDSQDVSSRNGGLLVFVKGQKTPEYVSWRKVDTITFD